MTEYQDNTHALPVTSSFTLTVRHVGLLSQMSYETGINKSELVRRAIELLYSRIETINDKASQETQTA